MKPYTEQSSALTVDAPWNFLQLENSKIPKDIATFISYLNTPLSIYNHEQKKFIYVNEPFLRLSGLTKEEAYTPGQRFYGLWIADEDYDIIKDAVRKKLAGVYADVKQNNNERLSYMVNFRFKDKEGLRHMLVQTNVLSWKENHTPKCTVDLYSDIAHRMYSNKILLTVNQFKPFEKEWKMILEEQFLRMPRELGKRELEIFGAIVTDLSATSIAKALGISVFTVRAHWRNILNKLNCHTQKELKHLALEEGWL